MRTVEARKIEMLENPHAVPNDLRPDPVYMQMVRGLSRVRLWDDGRSTDEDRLRLLVGHRWWVELARILREAAPPQVTPHMRWRFFLFGDFYEMWIRPYLGRRTEFWDFLVSTGKERLHETGEA